MAPVSDDLGVKGLRHPETVSDEIATSIVASVVPIRYTGRPGGVSGYPRAWYRSVFREFESPRVHTHWYKFVRTFSSVRTN